MTRTATDSSAELEEFAEHCRAFCARFVGEEHAAWERAGRTPREFWRQAGAAGLLGLAVPVAHGGPGRDAYRWQATLIKEIIAAGLTAPGIVAHNDIVASFLLARGSAEQKARWLPGCLTGELIAAIAITEPTGGSDLAGLNTTATLDEDTWVINGTKAFITNGHTADLIFVVCRTSDAPGTRGLGMLVVERGTPGLHQGQPVTKLGWHASDTADLHFDDCRVSVSNMLGTPGAAAMYLMSGMPRERLSIAVVAIAAAERVLQLGIDHARTRLIHGRALGALQAPRFTLAELDTEVTLGRVFVEHCITELDAGRLTIGDAAKAKWWTTELQARVADRVLQLHGAHGYLADHPVAREYVNARVQSIYGGTTEVMKELIGRSLGL